MPKSKGTIKIIVFSAPFILCLIFLVLSGELWPVDLVISIQKEHQVLYGPFITERNIGYYKAEMTRINMRESSGRTNVLALGDSTIHQIRSAFFNEDVNFYNACLSVKGVGEIKRFLEFQDTDSIDFLIVDLFQPYFVPSRFPGITKDSNYAAPQTKMSLSLERAPAALLIEPKVAYSDYIKNVFDISLIGQLSTSALNGFLNDGSRYMWEKYYNLDTDAMISSTISLVKNGDGPFVRSSMIDQKAIEYLDELLKFCKENDIYLIAFSPPFSPAANVTMELDGGFGYQTELTRILQDKYEQYDFEFYDYTDISALGCTDDYFLDGFHCGDVANLRIFIDMIKKGSRLSEICDIKRLKSLDDSRDSNSHMFDSLEEYQG